jgi:hypothetical protein
MAKVDIVNLGLLEIGHETLTALPDPNNQPLSTKVSAVFEGLVTEVMSDDWYFNRTRVLLSSLTQIYKLTVDTAPTAAAFSVGATLTGVSSAKTCKVVAVLSSTVYLVTKPSGDFTDGEILSDGTNSVNCDTGYPLSEEDLGMGQYSYAYQFPTDCIHHRELTDIESDDAKYRYKPEGNIFLTNANPDEAYFHYNRYLGTSGTSDLTLVPLRAQSWFYRLISMKLALVLSPNITENLKIKPKAEEDYRIAYLEAKEKNGEEQNEIDYSGSRYWSDSAWSEINCL